MRLTPETEKASAVKTNVAVVAAAVAVAAAILTLELMVPPIIGLANNGDFSRVMDQVGLQYLTDSREDNFVNWIPTKFAIVAPGWHLERYLTSQTVLAAPAVLGARILPGAPLFDIRVIGALHAILLLVSIGVIVAACRELTRAAQWLVAALLVFVFTDVGYAAPFNSLYSQTASLLFLLLTAAIAAVAVRRGRLESWLLAGYFVCAALFVASKPQESVHGPLMAAFALSLAGARVRKAWRQPAVWLALALCVFSVWYYRRTPDWLRHVTLYNSLFREVLPNSPNPARDLEELGLPRAFTRYSNLSPYTLTSPLRDPAFQAQLFGKLGYRALVRFYLHHPERLVSLFERATQSAFQLRAAILANYAKESGRPRRTMTAHFAWWSDLRARLGGHALLWLTLLFGGNLAACSVGYRRASRRGRLIRQGVALLILMACAEFLVVGLADIVGEIARHLYTFHALCDLLLIADATWLAQALASREGLPENEPAPA